MLEQENYADKELVVGSLKVLGNVSGRESEKVRQNLEMLQNTVKSQQARQDNYWNSLTADGVISAVEKKQLKKEFEGIEQTHTALMKQASDKGILDSGEIDKYNEAFTNLKEYLFTKLQLFKRMTEKTEIESSEVFNKYYSDYYFALQNAQARVTIGEPGKIRVLSSLTEPGTDEEVALYENNFYRYDLQNHEWIGISVASKLGEYMGVRTDSPPQVLNQYFLVGPTGITEDFLEFIPDGRAQIDNAWTDENGNIIFINYGFEPGYIYFWNENNEFEKVEDKNNWRYIIALNDMIANEFEVSPQLYEWLTGSLAEDIGDSVEEKIFEHIPKYERVKRLPENPNNGDWILWDAASTSRFTKGHLYIYQKVTVEWIELDPNDESGAVRSKFMAALTDILEVNQADEVGYFGTVFAKAFFANTATLKTLSTTTIELDDNGSIKSKHFTAGTSRGWIFNGDGTAKLNSVEILGYAKDEDIAAADEKIAAADKKIEAAQKELDEVAKNYIAKVDVEYALSESQTEAPTEGWSTLAPEYEPGKYMWQRTVTYKGDAEGVPSEPTCIAGAAGKSVKEFREQYALSTSKEIEPSESDWIDDQPEIEKNKVLWTRTKITWDDESIDYTDALVATAIDQVYSDVTAAQSKLGAVTEEKNNAVYLKGEISQNGTTDWAFRTSGFTKTSSKGLGIDHQGNVWGNNCTFKNGYFEGNGEFSGNVKIGSQSLDTEGYLSGTAIENGVVRSNDGFFKTFHIQSMGYLPATRFYGNSISFLARINTRVTSIHDKSNLFNRIAGAIPIDPDGNFAHIATGFIRITESSQSSTQYSGPIYGIAGGSNHNYVRILFGNKSDYSAPHNFTCYSNGSTSLNSQTISLNLIDMYLITLKGY